MTVRSDITGLTEVGSTAQTIALANVLARSVVLRQEVRALLDTFEKPTRYFGEDGDRDSHASTVLADIIRQYDGHKIY